MNKFGVTMRSVLTYENEQESRDSLHPGLTIFQMAETPQSLSIHGATDRLTGNRSLVRSVGYL